MKHLHSISACSLSLPFFFVLPAQGADVTKDAAGTDLNAGASWGGTAPGPADIAVWDALSLNSGLLLNSDAEWGGIRGDGAAGDIDISGSGILTLGASGIDTSAISSGLTLGNDLVISSPQLWTTGSSFVFSGNISGSDALTIAAPSLTQASYNSYLTTTDVVAFPNTTLADFDAASGVMDGAFVAGTNVPAQAYKFENDGTTATFQLRFLDDVFTKCVGVELTQSGPDVLARARYAKFINGADLSFDFDTGGNDSTVATGPGAAGYGAAVTNLQGGVNGTVDLTGDNSSLTGGLTLSGGLITGGAGVAFNGTEGGSFGSGPLTIDSGATLVTADDFSLGGGNQTNRPVTLDNATANIEAGGAGGEYIRFLNMTAGTLTADTGSIFFRAPNGGTEITTLAADSLSRVTTGIDLTLGNLSVDVDDGAAADDLSISGNISQNTGAGSGDKSLTKNGTGVLLLSGANSYTGGNVVNAGTVKMGNTNALGGFLVDRPASQNTVADGATIDLNGTGNATYGFTIAGTGVGGVGALTNSGGGIGNGLAQTSNIALTADASIGGTGNWALLTNGFGTTNLDLSGNTLTKVGTNIISLATTTATAGNVQISEGTLALGVTNSAASAVDASAAAFVIDDTVDVTLEVVRPSSIGSLAGGGLNGGLVNITADGNLSVGALGTNTSFDGLIEGTGGFIKTGGGTLTLTDNDNYDGFEGPTTVEAGTLALSGLGFMGFSSAITINDGATLAAPELQVDPDQVLAGEGTVDGDLLMALESILDVNGLTPGSLDVSGELIVDDTVNVTVSAAPTGSPSFDVIGFGSYTGNAATDFTLDPSFTARPGFAFSSTVDHIQLTLATESKTWTDALADGVWDAASSTNWTGGTDSLFYDLDSVTFGDTGAGAVSLAADITAGDVSFANTVGNDYTLGGSGLSFNGTLALTGDGNVTIDSVISGSGSLTQSGGGNLTLNAANSLAGPITIESGQVFVLTNTGLGSGDVLIGTGADATGLFLENRADIDNEITVSGGGTGLVTLGSTNTGSGANAATFNGTLTLERPTTISSQITDDRLALDGQITGNVGLLTVTGGSRTSVLSTDNDFVGDIVVSGTDTILQTSVGTAPEVIPDSSNVTVEAGSIFQMAPIGNGTETINALNGSGTVRSFLGQAIPGVLAVGGNDGSGSFDGLITNGTDATSFTKLGTGTQSLTGDNSYTGPTQVDGGTLLVNGNQAAATGDVGIAAGATLGGDGSLGGPLLAATGSIVAPGNSVGTLTAGADAGAGDSALEGTLEVEIDGATADQLVVANGAVDVTGLIISFSELSTPSANSYVLISAPGGVTGTLGAPTGLPTGYEVNVGATEVTLDVVGAASPYDDWIALYPALAGNDTLPTADPDGDGVSNQAEFAFDGNPDDAADNGKVFAVIADGDDAGDTEDELVLTLAVRTGASFAASGSPLVSAGIDGIVYSIGGSLDLTTYGTQVNLESTAVGTAGLPAPTSGWEYLSFSLEGSNGLPSLGFLRATVTADLP